MCSYKHTHNSAVHTGLKNIPFQKVNPDDIMPGSKLTWRQAFTKRFNDKRNIEAGGVVPSQGLKEQPAVVGQN